MFGDLRATLYDVFGYLMPGLLTVFGIAVAFPSAASLAVPELVADLDTAAGVSALTFISYVVGHAIQALGNALPPFSQKEEDKQFGAEGMPGHLVARARKVLSERVASDCESIPASDLYELLDEARVAFASEGDREMYTYREGFYRGMSVAAFVLSLALLVALARSSSCLSLGSGTACTEKSTVVFAALVAGACGFGFFARMRRFAGYRVRRALYRFLVGASPATSSEGR